MALLPQEVFEIRSYGAKLMHYAETRNLLAAADEVSHLLSRKPKPF